MVAEYPSSEASAKNEYEQNVANKVAEYPISEARNTAG